MDPSYLKDLLWRGREVEFVFQSQRYTVKQVQYRATTEYAFGKKWGSKITSNYFDGILYSRELNGYSLSDMLSQVSSSQVYVY